MYAPANPRFTIQKWGIRGYSFYGHVFMMKTEKKWQYKNNKIQLQMYMKSKMTIVVFQQNGHPEYKH